MDMTSGCRLALVGHRIDPGKPVSDIVRLRIHTPARPRRLNRAPSFTGVLVEDLRAEAVLLGGTDLGLAFAGRDPGPPGAEPGAASGFAPFRAPLSTLPSSWKVGLPAQVEQEPGISSPLGEQVSDALLIGPPEELQR